MYVCVYVYLYIYIIHVYIYIMHRREQVLASNAGNADNRSSSPFSLIPSTRSPDPLKQVSLKPKPWTLNPKA